MYTYLKHYNKKQDLMLHWRNYGVAWGDGTPKNLLDHPNW